METAAFAGLAMGLTGLLTAFVVPVLLPVGFALDQLTRKGWKR